ncbi:MAG: phosphatidylserine decarboxylase family protein [Bacteroidales bacterium]|nr:phosphatidylserine decarboxylase family protein [Bacteroidales bacterium]
MKIHKEGYPTILVTFLVFALLAFIANWLFPAQTYYHAVFYGILICLQIFFIRFFRVPNRSIEINENHIIAPADGEIVVIEEMIETEFFKGKRKQISIFMSPLNVHVNYAPVEGKIIYKKHNPGRFLVAWLPKSSTENESHSIVIENNKAQILVKQIAGAVARRIVCHATEQQVLSQGEEFGIIKFGSRVDLYLPLNVEVKVKIGQQVRAKKTVIAEFV